MSNIRAAREFCFQFFFNFQLANSKESREELVNASTDTLRRKIIELKETTGHLLNDKDNHFAETQISSALKNYDQIELMIEKHLKNWEINRLARVDHTILLLAVNELAFTRTAPLKVVINESIETAKLFGTKESPSFINGVLDSVAKEF